MPYITSFEKIAKEEGHKEGHKEGRKEEGLNVVMRLLNKKFGAITKAMKSKIEALSIKKLEALAESLLDFNDVSDLERWLSQK
ncbi:MAG: DUF4351 domain-containing protein [Blastocatellia bacterium]|nr:DUF4351 domain-containing protein [Blastocatellia bacterium]